MASFSMADKEGERLLFRRPLKNRSAESSPMTTLQKGGNAPVFSSYHSSPSNSYNKYFGGSGAKVSSPPGTIQKSVKSPPGMIQKNYCSPLAATTSSERASAKASATSPKRSPGDPKSSFPDEDRDRHHDYANVSMTKEGVLGGRGESTVLEAQRKVSAATAGAKGVGSRERRNSFREAVEKGKEEGEAAHKTDEPGKMAYESIWFEEGGDDRGHRRHPHHHHHHRKGGGSRQKAEPQSTGRREGGDHRSPPSLGILRHPQQRPEQREQRQQVRSRHAISGNYENVTPADSNGYEPVHFGKEGELQSVGLVAEVLSRSQRQQRHSSDNGGGGGLKVNPPPYKEPPQPSRSTSQQPVYSPHRQPLVEASRLRHSEQQPPRQQHQYRRGQHSPPPDGHSQGLSPRRQQHDSSMSPPPHSMNENSNAYVNVNVARRSSRDSAGKAKV